jgi:hypothetical protein
MLGRAQSGFSPGALSLGVVGPNSHGPCHVPETHANHALAGETPPGGGGWRAAIWPFWAARLTHGSDTHEGPSHATSHAFHEDAKPGDLTGPNRTLSVPGMGVRRGLYSVSVIPGKLSCRGSGAPFAGRDTPVRTPSIP